MTMPENGKVIVIDDEEKEALPLIKVLSINNIPAIFFTGKQSEFPKNLLKGIRLVFLDLKLVNVSKEKIIKSTIRNTLGGIISENNGPYILVLWSVHEADYSASLQALFNNELAGIRPVITLSIDKQTYLRTQADGEKTFVSNALRLIETRLRRELKKAGAFHFFFLWENLVHDSSGDAVNCLSSFYPADNNWNKNISSLILELAKANAGENLNPENRKEVIKNAYLAFNGTFDDSLVNKIRTCQYLGNVRLDENPAAVSREARANVNSRLLLNTSPGFCSPEPGNVYLNRVRGASKVNVSDVFEGGKEKLDSLPEKTKLIKLARHIFAEVSPICDYAHASEKLRANRVLPGILWPIDFIKRLHRSEYLYVSQGVFQIGDNQYKLVFDFRRLTSLPLAVLKSRKKPFLKIRQELLVDILAHMSKHVNRPGVTSL